LKSIKRYGIQYYLVVLLIQFTMPFSYKHAVKKPFRDGKEEWIQFDSSPYGCSSAFDAASPILREVASALHSMGIPVEQVKNS
jgi:glutamine synthetase